MTSQLDDFAIPTTILRHFDLASTPWTELSSPQIESRRRRLPEGKLFYDRLLELAGLEGQSLYPPNTPAAVRRLLHGIYSSPFDRLKRDCLFYYLLKDYDATVALQAQPSMDVDGDGEDAVVSHVNQGDGRAQAYAKRRCLPRTWTVFMDGYWSLDHSLWETAVTDLSDPSITTLNFVPAIIQTLSTLVSPPSHALKLVHGFLISAQPELTSQDENDVRLVAVASAGSISQAFGLIRAVGAADERHRLRELIWCWVLGAPRTACGPGEHGVQSKALKQLLHLPLGAEEDQHLIDFLSHPPRTISPPALSLLHDMVTLRLIHQGQYQDSLQLDKELAGSGGKEEDRQRRREMVREFIAILPEAHRAALLVQVGASNRDDGAAITNESAAMDMDISSSSTRDERPTILAHSVPYGVITSKPPAPSVSTNPPLIAPTPVRSASYSALAKAQHTPLTNSPARVPSSPFAGPPRFAQSSPQVNPSPKRIMSGSPFHPPTPSSSTSANATRSSRGAASVPRLPRMVINDDDEQDAGSVTGRQTRAQSDRPVRARTTRATSKSVEPEQHSRAGDSGDEREGMSIDGDGDGTEKGNDAGHRQSVSQEPRPAGPPASTRKPKSTANGEGPDRGRQTTTPPPSRVRPRRQSTAPVTPGLVDGMPGAFSFRDGKAKKSKDGDKGQDEEQDKEKRQSRESEDEMPPPPVTRSRASSAVPESARKGSRMTRSASRAIMDVDEEQDGFTPGPPSKKLRSTRRAAAPAPDDAEVTGSVRRRATRSTTAGLSEQGSPTPSVGTASEAGSVATRRSARVREGSATPRMATRRRA
ncbi:hypothetical protein IAU60_002171 [Kwoniella sp. DSM 27419]